MQSAGAGHPDVSRAGAPCVRDASDMDRSPVGGDAARRDRLLLLAGLLGVSLLAWAMTIAWADHGASADTALHVHARPWGARELGAGFLMWGVMMVAMMAPTAAPMLLALARIARAQPGSPGPLPAASACLLGYLAVWTAFSAVATLAQWRLHDLALVSASGAAHDAVLAGALLLGAGAYQLTPIKRACLGRCRSPLVFLMRAWRPGAWGGLRMGILQGAFCVGCCWALMALMFIGGTMNLVWAAGLVALMLGEKMLPMGGRLGDAAGVGLVAWGCTVLCSALLAG